MYKIFTTAISIFLFCGCHSGEHKEHDAEKESHTDHEDEIILTQEEARDAGVKVETIKPTPFAWGIKVGGQIEPSQGDERSIVAMQSGIVSLPKTLMTEGVKVGAGQTLFTISAKNMADGDPAVKAKAEFDAAKNELERSEKLATERIVSKQELDDARRRFDIAKATLSGFKNGGSACSPISGYIKSCNVRNGDYVTAGQVLAVVAENKQLTLRADLPQNYASLAGSINSANFKPSGADSYISMAQVHGTLLSSSKSINNNSGYIPIYFKIDNIGTFISGSYAEVYVIGGNKKTAMSVANEALTEEQGSYFVYIQIDEEGYRKQEVKIGQSNGERTEILTGLKSGDKVVCLGAYRVRLTSMKGSVPEGHNHNH